MRNPLVTVDAGGLPLLAEVGRVHLGGTLPLQGEVHVLEVVAVAALARICLFHPLPLPLRHLAAVTLELLAGVHLAGDHAPQLLGSLHLADDLVGPLVRYVAIRAAGAHTGAVGVVDGVAILLEHVVLHLVTAGTEGFGVGSLHGGVETAPEDNAAKEAHQQQHPEGRLGGGFEGDPQTLDKAG